MSKNVKIISEPYLYNGEFKTLNGDSISYSHLCVDLQVGDTTLKLKRTLKGLEKDYVKSLLESDKSDIDFIED